VIDHLGIAHVDGAVIGQLRPFNLAFVDKGPGKTHIFEREV
jgi:hypothetical protein